MASGMWFAVVKPDQPLNKKVKFAISLTQAVLDTENAKETDGITRLMMSMDGQNVPIANLSMKHGLLQTPLKLEFGRGDRIKLSVPAGSGPVSVFGCARLDTDDLLEEAAKRYEDMMQEEGVSDDDDVEEEEDSDDDDDDEEEEDEEGEEETEEAQISKKPTGTKRKRKGNPLLDHTFPSDDESDHSYYPTEEDLNNESRREELNLLEGEEEIESEEDDEDDGDEEMEDEELEGEDSDDDEEEGEEEEEEDEEEEEEVVVPEPSKKKMKLQLLNGHAEAVPQQQEQQKKKKDVLKDAKNKTPQKEASKPAAANSTPTQKGEKASKIKLDNKENEHKGTPKQEKKKQKGDKSPAAKANEGSVTKTPKKMMMGGVMGEDITEGKGPAAKNGAWVSVYYEGRLKSNNAVFDKAVTGPPFKFRLGRGEVIKGWDVGVLGMKVGGKRKLTIPPNMGYGKQGSGKVIPPNSTLCFDVTLIAVN